MALILLKMAMLMLAAASNAHSSPGGYFYNNPNSYYGAYTGGYATYHGHAASPHVLTVLEERPLAADPISASVPLVVVPQEQIHVVHGDISGVSRVKPYVQVKVQDHMEEAMPAVKVQLRRPILISSLHSTIAFPSRFTVLHNGYSMPINVGTVLAPLPSGTAFAPNHPVSVSYVYAIPSGPVHYPAYYHQSPNYLPVYYNHYAPASVAKPVRPLHTVPAKPQQPSAAAAPAPTAAPVDNNNIQDPQIQNRPDAPIVTVLDFPSNVASPPALFYQPPATGLGNREPPQAVAPAGIVQSTQPQSNLSVFFNSKESPYLQILRDEAQRNRNKAQQNYNDETQAVFVN